MGTKNRQRRQEKQRARVEQQRRRQERVGGERGAPVGPLPAHVVEPLARQAVIALHRRDDADAWEYCAVLADGARWIGGQRAVDAALFAVVQHELTAAWSRGWQPADVVRFVRRERDAQGGRVILDAIAAEMRGYAAATVDEGWDAQLRALDANVWWGRDDEYIAALGAREGIARLEVIRCLVEVVHVLAYTGSIQMLCSPPGKARRGSLATATATGRAADQRQLDRVRALLAKAESTTFAEEAETYTAKAQELMARHSIDYALLAAQSGTRDEPTGRRIGIDNPYEGPKALLLDAVAGANRCRAVWSSSHGFVTVLGFPADIDAVELLFTSLLVQATTAMTHAGSRRDAYGRSTTRSFRQSFLTAYAQRIGERLATVTKEATEQAGREMAGQVDAERLLPVLASREAAVGALTDELFPTLVGKSVGVSNREGWASGRAAADLAQLTPRQAVDS